MDLLMQPLTRFITSWARIRFYHREAAIFPDFLQLIGKAAAGHQNDAS
jgi:hypothetical protein